MSQCSFIPDFSGQKQYELSYKKDYATSAEWLREARRLFSSRDVPSAAICVARAMLCSPTDDDKATAHMFLQKHTDVFWSFYEKVSADSRSLMSYAESSAFGLSQEQQQIVSELRKDGIAVWHGGCAGWPRLQAARRYCEEVYREHISSFGTFDDAHEHKIQAPSVVKSTVGNYEFTGEPGNGQGRYRALFPVWQKKTGIPIVDELIFDDQIREIVRQYYSSDIQENYMLLETLKPGTEQQKLHIDGMGDQLKVMVLLEDVTAADGPLVFEKRSHRPSATLFNHVNAWFHKAPDHPVTDTQRLRADGIREWVVTGKKGDCIFFDSHALHRGTPCSTGERRNLVLSYGASTLRSHLMYMLDRGNIPEAVLMKASETFQN